MNTGNSYSEMPNFLSASSLAGLRRAMLFNNIAKGYFFKYFDIQKTDGKWIAWYYENVDYDVENIVKGGQK